MTLLWICAARRIGGAENTTLQILRMLGERGWRIDVLCRAGALADAARAAGFPVRTATFGGSLSIRAVLAIRAALRHGAPDAALATGADEWVWACLARARRMTTRLVLVRFMMLPLSRRVQRLAGRRADAVVAVSDAVRRSLVDVPADKVHVIRIPYRIPPRSDVPTVEERLRARRAVGLPDSGRCVAFFGGLDPKKGIADVLSAVAGANRRLGEVHLAVCGPPDEAASTRSRLAAAELPSERLHVLGTVDRVDPVMTAADAVVLATHSDLGEAIPLTALEAMACGTPVCGYDIGGVAEALGPNGEAGVLALSDDPSDLGRALTEILADPGRSHRIAVAALERLRREFDPAQTAWQYEKLIGSLVRGS